MTVTIGIKALNEERHIGRSIESALAAAVPVGGDVVLADSGSTDRTLSIAADYPIRVVQLANLDERCCGAGAQLAFQNATGTYFYLLDGDMVIDPTFVREGIAFLDAHPDHAGVGGRVREMNTVGQGFQIRARVLETTGHWNPGEVDRLDCGGLYRVAALREAGWFADRNLHAFEEFDLAARLRARGWKLARIDLPAVDHYGHLTSGYKLLWRRLKTGYAGAAGEVLRAALGQRHLPLVLRGLQHIRFTMVIAAWWLALLLTALLVRPAWATIAVLAALVAGPVLFLSWRRGGFKLGLYSFVEWNVGAIGFLGGFLRPRVAPSRPLASVDLSERRA